MQWEYLILVVSKNAVGVLTGVEPGEQSVRPEGLVDALTKLGQARWELVSISDADHYFKREAAQAPAHGGLPRGGTVNTGRR